MLGEVDTAGGGPPPTAGTPGKEVDVTGAEATGAEAVGDEVAVDEVAGVNPAQTSALLPAEHAPSVASSAPRKQSFCMSGQSQESVDARDGIANIRATGTDAARAARVQRQPRYPRCQTPLDRKLCVPAFRRVCQNLLWDIERVAQGGQQATSRTGTAHSLPDFQMARRTCPHSRRCAWTASVIQSPHCSVRPTLP